MDKHFFVGIPVPTSVAAKLDEARTSWNMQSHKIYSSPEDMHITLFFIGSASGKQVSRLIEELASMKQPRFTLAIKGVETFGNPATPRVVYAAIEDEPALHQLHQKVVSAVELCGLGGQDDKFTPHITLAKKWAGGEPFRAEPELSPASFEVTSFSVFEIQPWRQPKYMPLSTVSLI